MTFPPIAGRARESVRASTDTQHRTQKRPTESLFTQPEESVVEVLQVALVEGDGAAGSLHQLAAFVRGFLSHLLSDVSFERLNHASLRATET